jgi:hypothetical protein
MTKYILDDEHYIDTDWMNYDSCLSIVEDTRDGFSRITFYTEGVERLLTYILTHYKINNIDLSLKK